MNDLEKTLGLLDELLSPVSTNWLVIGSASLYLHGLPIKPQDIDILCDAKTAIGFEALLSAYRIETEISSGKGKFSSRFSQYMVNGTAVEVMGDLLVNMPAGWVNVRDMIGDPAAVQLDGRTFLIPGIDDQVKIYTLFGREKDQSILALLGRQ